MKWIVLLLMASLSQAQSISQLHTEFLRRDTLKLSLAHGGVINYLRLLKFPVATIIDLSVDDQQNFILKDSAGQQCQGNVLEQTFDCSEIRWSAEQEKVIQFLKGLSYATENILEIEVMGVAGQEFLIKDKGDMICLGNMTTEMLRCKNPIGITGVLYSGDSD